MSAVPNTLRRAGIYHFRRAVPVALRSLLGRSELNRSLKTADVSLARTRARLLYLTAEGLFSLVRSEAMLDERQIAELMQRFYAHELGEENRLRLSTGVQFDEANRKAAIAYFQRLDSDVRGALARNELYRADAWVTDLLEREGLEGELDPLSRAQLQQAILRTSRDVTAAMLGRFEGDFHHEPRDALLAKSEPGSAQTLDAQSDRPALASGGLGRNFTVAADEVRETRTRRGIWEQQTSVQARKSYQLFAELCGDRPLAGYLRDDAVRFKNLLSDLPAMYGKAAKYRGLSADAIVAASLNNGEPRLSSGTIHRHITALSVLWDEAIERGEVAVNIFSKLKVPGGKRPKDQRPMWSTDKLRQLYDSPVWRGCRSAERRSRPGPFIIRDERYWLPLIALFTGMRAEEICQLHVCDVRQESGVWVFDINDAPPRQLKNANAIRLVPIHSQLIKLGLIAYVEAARTAGHDRVFMGLQRGGADHRLGHNYSKWFTRYRRDIGLYEPGLDFHAFRHSATTFLVHGGVPVHFIDELTGHETSGETARYTKSFLINQLKDAIEKLDPGINLAFLFSESSAAVVSTKGVGNEKSPHVTPE